MVRPERVGRDPATGHELFLLELEAAAELPEELALPSPAFVAFLCWDAEGEDVATLARVAERLLDAGCAAVCAWGAGCSRVDDVVDEVAVERELGAGGAAEVGSVDTSWHEDAPLEEALWYFLRVARPDEAREAACRSALAVVVGGDAARRARVRRGLQDPERLAREVTRDAPG